MKQKLKLEVGKKYVTAEGKVHGPMKITASHPDRFTDEQGSWYGGDGHYWQQGGWDCPFRLVAEHREETQEEQKARWEAQKPIIAIMLASSCFGQEVCKFPPCQCAQGIIDTVRAIGQE